MPNSADLKNLLAQQTRAFRQFYHSMESWEFTLPEFFVTSLPGMDPRDTRGIGNITCHLGRYKSVADALGEDDDVLDIGCGCGLGSRIYRLKTDGRVVAADKAFAIEVARMWYPAPGVEYVVCDFDSDPLPEGPFDICVMLEVLEHLSETTGRRVLDHVRRNLRSGGKLMVSAPTEDKRIYGYHVRLFGSVESVVKQCAERLLPTQSVVFVHVGGLGSFEGGTYVEP